MKRYTVFVSSTSDLEDERAVAKEAIHSMNCHSEAMEEWASSNVPPSHTIQRRMAHCDFFLLLAGFKYGSLSRNKRSYVENEYWWAVQGHKEMVVLLKEQDGTPIDDSQKRFREELRKKATIKAWKQPHEITKFVMQGLFDKIRERERADVFEDNPHLVDPLGNYLAEGEGDKGRERRNACVIQYSAANAIGLVRPLLSAGVPTRLYVISPQSDWVISNFQTTRVENSLRQMRNEYGSQTVDKLLTVYGYKAPGALRAVLVEKQATKSSLPEPDFLAVSSYVYKWERPEAEWTVDIRGGEMPGVILRPGHCGFIRMAEMVTGTLSNWHENEEKMITRLQIP